MQNYVFITRSESTATGDFSSGVPLDNVCVSGLPNMPCTSQENSITASFPPPKKRTMTGEHVVIHYCKKKNNNKLTDSLPVGLFDREREIGARNMDARRTQLNWTKYNRTEVRWRGFGRWLSESLLPQLSAPK